MITLPRLKQLAEATRLMGRTDVGNQMSRPGKTGNVADQAHRDDIAASAKKARAGGRILRKDSQVDIETERQNGRTVAKKSVMKYKSKDVE